ncbi:hypothetical protein C1645_813279 [Glomus cerebriforme]|uniref:Uncharacterized protein n=1 Tax=Glomus cerebriforme TaxID=658196 RepID=A0A397TJC4_9GLOM|nr:hypothetical protein C1645_813279 [Glomus cerebriforme]
MNFYIQRRISDLTDNQRRMINSLLNRTPKLITLDKLQIRDKNNEISYTIDPNEIEKLARTHFQTLGNPNMNQVPTLNDPSDLPMEWQNIFLLADHVRSQCSRKIKN